MKRLISLFFILIGLGIFLKVTGSFSNFSFGGAGVAPVEEWEEILPGKWKIDWKYKSSTYGWTVEGEVEYLANGNFTKYITIKYYSKRIISGSNVFAKRYLQNIYGGNVTGKWVVKGDGIHEVIVNCGMKNADSQDKYDICKNWFPKDNEETFGTLKTESISYETKVFSRDKILIKGKDFSDDGEDTFIFTRIDN